MIKTTTFILFFMIGQIPVSKYHNRFDDKSLKKMSETFEYTRQTSINTNVPEKYILGVIFNESGGNEKIIGDGGKAYGYGQIWCFWRHKFENIGVQSCEDLLDGEKNIAMIGLILSHLKKKDLTWKQVLSMYNLGPKGKRFVDRPYVHRTIYFGEHFLPYYKIHKRIVSFLL